MSQAFGDEAMSEDLHDYGGLRVTAFCGPADIGDRRCLQIGADPIGVRYHDHAFVQITRDQARDLVRVLTAWLSRSHGHAEVKR